MKYDNLILFPHIPKTGGSSFLESMKEALGDQVYTDYVNPLSFSKFKSRSLRYKFGKLLDIYKLRINRSALADKRVVYGHYPFKRYSFLTDAKKGLFFRDPIDLVCSYYYHIFNKWGERQRKNLDSLESFIFTDDMKYFYDLFLSSEKIENLDFVGITEYYIESLYLFEKIFGIRLVEKKVNKASPKNYKQILVNKGIYEEVVHFLENQIGLYECARNRFRQLCEKNSITISINKNTD